MTIKRAWTTVEEVAPWISLIVVLTMSQMKCNILGIDVSDKI